MPSCVLYEDDDLLVVHKPAGMNTHAPAPFAGEGIYDWLRNREPRWAPLATIHRLDKETSGVLVFSKTPAANRSLTNQFAKREVRKKYLLLTDRAVTRAFCEIRSAISRAGDKYVSRPEHAGGDLAETRFRVIETAAVKPTPGAAKCIVVEAEPLTGRTHQIRVHAAALGFPILGDTLYGGTPSGRVCLHAASLGFKHPANGEQKTFEAPPAFDASPRESLRALLIDSEDTDAFRVIHGASDGWAGWHVDRLGCMLLSQNARLPSAAEQRELARLAHALSARGAAHKILTRQVQRSPAEDLAPQTLLGNPAPEPLRILENGVRFELSLKAGYSAGLFLDQRDNRRRLLAGHVAAGFPLWAKPGGAPPTVLNAFAYTCGFSVCAAKSGAHVTSLDLSKNYLEWGRRNFELNGLDPARHDFIFGDVFEWLPRLARKERLFDLVLLDPPTFSQSKQTGVFRAEGDYGRLVKTALPLLKKGGVLFASTNAAGLAPEAFLKSVSSAIQSAGRKVARQYYAPQPPDFPISREEPAYLKTVWMQVV